MYYLIDWERTLRNGLVYYWVAKKHGYTAIRKNAGQFTKAEARKAVKDDINNKTCMLAVEFVNKVIEREN